MAPPASIERLSERVGVDARGRRVGGTTIRRLVAYYAFALVLTAAFVWLPSTPVPYVGHGKGGPLPVEGAPTPPVLLLAAGTMAIVGAFVLALPLAFVYVRTRSRLTYDRSLVQTVIMLPVVVTAILVVVQNSLALAFSLAGIVAAVRFRNTLEDSRDAVYILASVGIGFGAGVRQLPIAALLSLIFTLLELALWRFDLTADYERTFGLLCEPTAPADGTHAHGAAGAGAAAVGPAVLGAVAVAAAEAVLPVAPPAEARRKDVRLRLYLTEFPAVRAEVERVLDHLTKRWRLVEQRKGGVDQRVADYEVRLPAGLGPEQVIDRLYAETGADLIAAEVVPR